MRSMEPGSDLSDCSVIQAVGLGTLCGTPTVLCIGLECFEAIIAHNIDSEGQKGAQRAEMLGYLAVATKHTYPLQSRISNSCTILCDIAQHMCISLLSISELLTMEAFLP